MEDVVELRKYFQVIRLWLWLIVGCTLLGAIGAFLFSSRMTPVYSASTTLLVQQPSSSGPSDYSSILASERLAETYTEMLIGRQVMERIISLLGLTETPDELAERVKVKLVSNTQLILLSVEHTDPSLAALLANSIAETFIAQIQTLEEERYTDSLTNMQQQIYKMSALIEETQAQIDALSNPVTVQEQDELTRLDTILAGYRNTYATLQQNYEQMRLTAAQATHSVIVVETAHAPEIPIRPRTLINTVLAAVVGLMLSTGVAFLVEYLDDTIRMPDDVNRTLGLGTLGTIGLLAKEEESLVVLTQPLSPVAEAFRVLSTNIRFHNVDRSLKTILVTSPGGGEGKSCTVANLAIAMAQAGLSVVAVDADLRRPRLHHLFDLGPRHKGLTWALLEGSADGKLQPTQVEGLKVLPSGELPPNPAGILGSQRIQELLVELAQQVDVVLIDSPPALPVADAMALARGVDGVLLLLEAGKTRREIAQQVIESLRQVGANPIGVVLNGVTTHKGGYYSYDAIYGNGRGRRQKEYPTILQRLLRKNRKADAD